MPSPPSWRTSPCIRSSVQSPAICRIIEPNKTSISRTPLLYAMLDPHTSLGIAQTVFYVPMLPLAIWLMVRNGKIRPRMAWWPLIPFSLSR